MTTIKKIAKEEKANYLNDPHHCPLCGSYNITSAPFFTNFNGAWRDVNCLDCGRIWEESFLLVDIELQKERKEEL